MLFRRSCSRIKSSGCRVKSLRTQSKSTFTAFASNCRNTAPRSKSTPFAGWAISWRKKKSRDFVQIHLFENHIPACDRYGHHGDFHAAGAVLVPEIGGE